MMNLIFTLMLTYFFRTFCEILFNLTSVKTNRFLLFTLFSLKMLPSKHTHIIHYTTGMQGCAVKCNEKNLAKGKRLPEFYRVTHHPWPSSIKRNPTPTQKVRMCDDYCTLAVNIPFALLTDLLADASFLCGRV